MAEVQYNPKNGKIVWMQLVCARVACVAKTVSMDATED
jgi:hypothetical protein